MAEVGGAEAKGPRWGWCGGADVLGLRFGGPMLSGLRLRGLSGGLRSSGLGSSELMWSAQR